MMVFYSGFGIDRCLLYKTDTCFCMKADMCLAKVSFLSIPNKDIIFVCQKPLMAFSLIFSPLYINLFAILTWRFYNRTIELIWLPFNNSDDLSYVVKRSIIYFLCMIMFLLCPKPTYVLSLTSVLTQMKIFESWCINHVLLTLICWLVTVYYIKCETQLQNVQTNQCPTYWRT